MELPYEQIDAIQRPLWPQDWMELTPWGQIIYANCEREMDMTVCKDHWDMKTNFIGIFKYYMRTHPAWASLRERVESRASNCCERCRKLPIDRIVHVNGAKMFDEDDKDVVALCNCCYKWIKSDGKKGLDALLSLEHHISQM